MVEWLVGTTLMLPAVLSPVIAWELVMLIASRLSGGVG